jgi:hypothetical protein
MTATETGAAEMHPAPADAAAAEMHAATAKVGTTSAKVSTATSKVSTAASAEVTTSTTAAPAASASTTAAAAGLRRQRHRQGDQRCQQDCANPNSAVFHGLPPGVTQTWHRPGVSKSYNARTPQQLPSVRTRQRRN